MPAVGGMKKSRLLLWAVLAFNVLVLGLGAYFVLRELAPSAPMIGNAFELVGPAGKVTDKDLVGRPTLMFFGYTHCPDVCPTAMFQISEIFNALGPQANVGALFVTVDPERDTPEVLKSYIASFDKRIVGLSGERPAVDAAIRAFRVYAKKTASSSGDYTMDHTAIVYLMDKKGRFVAPFNIDRAPADAAAELKKYL